MRKFIACPSEKACDNWPMAQAGCSGIDNEDWSISTNSLKADQVPDECADAQTFSQLVAGLLNAYYAVVDVTVLSPDQVMAMGLPEKEVDIPHHSNTQLPF